MHVSLCQKKWSFFGISNNAMKEWDKGMLKTQNKGT